MNVEQVVLKNLSKLLKIYDTNKEGFTLDVGVGTYNFYCEFIQNFDTIFKVFYEYGDLILFKEKKFNVFNNTIYSIKRLII